MVVNTSSVINHNNYYDATKVLDPNKGAGVKTLAEPLASELKAKH